MNNKNFDPKKIVTEFVQAFASGDTEKLRSIMAKEIKSYITNAEGGVNLLDGCDAFISNIEALDVKSVKPKVRITQMLTINENQVMMMIEGKMERKGRSFQNFAAYLMTFKDGLINEIQMVEAYPAESDEFWKC